MTYQFRPEASAVNPARAPSCVAVIPAGGAAGVRKPRMPSHHWLNGTTSRSTATRASRMVPTITQFASSSARLTRLAPAVIRNTSTSRPMAHQRGSTSSAAGGTPWTSAYTP